MKNLTTMIAVGSSISLSLLLVTVSVRSAVHFARANDAARAQLQSEYSDLQKDELNLASDVTRLRHDLRAGATDVAVTKERNFVRQDLLNIVLDRMEPAEDASDLERDQDLASLIGESFDQLTQKLIGNLEAASRV